MDKLSIVKIGGNVIENNEELADFLTAFTHMKGAKILVHGGGKKATLMAKKLGVSVKIIDGRRITDAENLDIITSSMVERFIKILLLNCKPWAVMQSDSQVQMVMQFRR